MKIQSRYSTLIAILGLTLATPQALAAPSDRDTSLVNDSVSGSGTGALVGFALSSRFAELKPNDQLSFIVSEASCYATDQVAGNLHLTLATTGQFSAIKGPPCSESTTPGSIARAGVYNVVKLSTGKYLLQADTEGLDIRLRLIRMNADGSIDTGFGTSGQLLPAKANGDAVLTGVGLRDAARMVVDAQDRLYISNGGNQVARLSADGTPDTSFGSGGYLTGPLENGSIHELALDSSGRLLIAGSRQEPIKVGSMTVQFTRYWLARYDANGNHDTSFRNELGGDSNIVRVQALNTQATQAVYVLLPEADGKLLVSVDANIRRYDASGTEVGSSPLLLGMLPMFAAVDASGRIVVSGHGAVARLKADLTADTAFDEGDTPVNGIRNYDLGSSRRFNDTRGRILFGTDGKITLVGAVRGTSGNGVAVMRLLGDSGSGGPVNDGTPDAFGFGINENATANATDTSGPQTITGINIPVAISVNHSAQGRGYSIGCNGSFTAEAGTIENGQSVCVRHTTGSPGTRTLTTLTVGGVAGTFESVVAAVADDTEPDAFPFTAVNDADTGAVVESGVREITGINTAAPISISGGEYRVLPGGAYTSANATVAPGQTLQVRVTAPATAGQSATATVTIGGVSSAFTVTTRLPPEASTTTIADAPGGAITLSTAGGTLVNARTVTQPTGAVSSHSYPNGFYAFDVEDVAAGSEVTVTITLPAASRPDAYIKCDASGSTCSEFAGATFNDNVVTLVLTDGGAGDTDGLANGTIKDPGAPAVKNVSPPATDDAPRSSGGALGMPLLLMLGLAWRLRRGRGLPQR